MNTCKMIEKMYAIQSRLSAYNHAMAIIYYDGATTAPKGTAENRAHALGILSEESYRISTSEETVSLLEELDTCSDELSDKDKRVLELMLRDIREMKKIPMEEYVSYQELLVRADDIWHRAKEASDFEMFRPALEQIFDYQKKFAHYCAPEKDPYDYCLGKYEDGLTSEKCDEFFGALKERIVPLIKSIGDAGELAVKAYNGTFPKDEQWDFSLELMRTMGIDMDHCGLGETEHPFTTSIGSHRDVRITTNFKEDDFTSSMYSVIHEGGHALYDMNSDDGFAYTILDGGISMGIHESQSRFYENLIGRSRAFVEYIFPKMQKCFPEQLNGFTADDIYRMVNRVEPSLIRTEADEVTYCLHVMIRYELERRIMRGELEVRDLPREWNRLYKEYLGVDVPDDRRGVLQDSHWSGGCVGYFPSYALGSAYGAHLLHKMSETVDVNSCLKNGDFTAINEWNREHIWRYGCMYKPGELLERALGEEFFPIYYVEYLEKKYGELYGV